MSMGRRIRNLFSRSKLEQEIDTELRSHIEMRIADNVAAGMSPEEARRDALLRFGNPTLTKESVTAADAALKADALWRDLHYAARQLRRSPSFTITAVLTLALGIGANVIVFSVLNALILKRLDVPQANNLYNIVQKPHGYDNQSYPDYRDYQALNTSFSATAAYRIQRAGLSTGKTATKCWFYEVSGNYFDMLGVQPVLGRLFHADDEHGPNSAPYLVLSETYWRSYFSGDPRVIGSTVEINKHPFTILGVAPRAFHGTELFFWPDFWVPMVNEQQIEGYDFLSKRGNHGIWMLGTLKPDISPQQATDNLNSIARQLAARYSTFDDDLSARLVTPGLAGDQLGDASRTFLFGIMLLAFLVLLAACANLASIFAARTADRSRELAIRLAIGSSRWHILRQVLSEAVLISLMGGLVGTLFSAVLLRALTTWQPFAEMPIHVTVVPDASVYGVAILLSVASGLLFGLLPVRQIWATSAAQSMKSGAQSTTLFRRFTLRDLLLGVQITLCTLLVMSSFVALRGMVRSLHAPLGFQPQNVTLAETDMQMAGHSDDASLLIQQRMLEESARIPGVKAVGTINQPPLGTGGSSSPVYPQGTTEFRTSNSVLTAKYYSISPGYLQAAGTRLLAGRDFSWHDDAKAPKVSLVNDTFARKMFGSSDAVGRRFMTGDKSSYEIVGVLENGKYDSLTEPPTPAMFYALAQSTDSDTTLVVRSQLPPSEIAPALDRMLANIDSSLPFTIHSWPDALALVLFPARVATASLGIMGLLAALLAVTGVFGMATYSVSKRMKELGIRIALGAQPVQVIRSALGRPLALLLCGSATGLLLGTIASRLLAQIVYQASPRDPFVLAGVIVTMSILGLLAIWIPARRVLRLDPAPLLRED
jgi:predicted permease